MAFESSWPHYSKSEILSVKRIIESGKVNYWTGNEGSNFEREFANYTDSKFAIAVSNGSVALDIASKILGFKKGDEIIVTPRSYIASVSCVVNLGAKPVFADIDLNSQNVTAKTIEKKITKKTKGIICVHLAGWPCEMDTIMKLAKKRKLKVIEDCSQAHGATYKGKKVGSFGDIGTFSFCNDKIISTLGEGGMITTNNQKLWKLAWEYKDHGRDYNKVKKMSKRNSFKWIISSFGSNYRLTETQSKVGRIQLSKLDNWLKKRNKFAMQIYNIAYSFDSIRKIKIPKNIKHSFYRCYLFIEPKKLKPNWNRNKIMNKINLLGVPCFIGSCPEIYLEKAFKAKFKTSQKRLKNARQLGDTSIAFLVHPNMTVKDIKKTCNALKKVLKEATKID